MSWSQDTDAFGCVHHLLRFSRDRLYVLGLRAQSDVFSCSTCCICFKRSRGLRVCEHEWGWGGGACDSMSHTRGAGAAFRPLQRECRRSGTDAFKRCDEKQCHASAFSARALRMVGVNGSVVCCSKEAPSDGSVKHSCSPWLGFPKPTERLASSSGSRTSCTTSTICSSTPCRDSTGRREFSDVFDNPDPSRSTVVDPRH